MYSRFGIEKLVHPPASAGARPRILAHAGGHSDYAIADEVVPRLVEEMAQCVDLSAAL